MKITAKDLKVGQKVWYVEPNELSRKRVISGEEVLHETEITKIGRKYFYVKSSRNGIEFSTMQDKTDYGFGYSIRIYIEKEQFLKNIEINRKKEKITEFFKDIYKLKYLTEEELNIILSITEKAEKRRNPM